ncbi:hypothetical protein [Sphingomonas sp.]
MAALVRPLLVGAVWLDDAVSALAATICAEPLLDPPRGHPQRRA